MILREGNLEFNFMGAIDACKFDERDSSCPTFHGLSHCMKAVDFVVEYEDHYVFVEVKDPPDPARYGTEKEKGDLLKNLVGKFRDSFIYRWCAGKLDKPIYYQCLVELDNAQTLYLMDKLNQQLPVKNTPSSWKYPLSSLCAVANQAVWNETFTDIPVTRVR